VGKEIAKIGVKRVTGSKKEGRGKRPSFRERRPLKRGRHKGVKGRGVEKAGDGKRGVQGLMRSSVVDKK